MELSEAIAKTEEYYNALTKLRQDHSDAIERQAKESSIPLERLKEEHASQLRVAELAREGSLSESQTAQEKVIRGTARLNVGAVCDCTQLHDQWRLWRLHAPGSGDQLRSIFLTPSVGNALLSPKSSSKTDTLCWITAFGRGPPSIWSSVSVAACKFSSRPLWARRSPRRSRPLTSSITRVLSTTRILSTQRAVRCFSSTQPTHSYTSHIGKTPIPVPPSVTLNTTPTNLQVTGPLGSTSVPLGPYMHLTPPENGIVALSVDGATQKKQRSMWGLTRTLINNAIVGMTEGFGVPLYLVGVGYRAALEDNPRGTENGGNSKRLKMKNQGSGVHPADIDGRKLIKSESIGYQRHR